MKVTFFILMVAAILIIPKDLPAGRPLTIFYEIGLFHIVDHKPLDRNTIKLLRLEEYRDTPLAVRMERALERQMHGFVILAERKKFRTVRQSIASEPEVGPWQVDTSTGSRAYFLAQEDGIPKGIRRGQDIFLVSDSQAQCDTVPPSGDCVFAPGVVMRIYRSQEFIESK